MQPLLIGPYDLGLQTDAKPFMIPDKAFPLLENASVFRGRVERKMGYDLLGRLRREVTVYQANPVDSPGAGVLQYTLFDDTAQIVPGNLSNITITFTFPGPVIQNLTNTDGSSTLTVSGGTPITAGTINYATGVLSLTFDSAVSGTVTFSGTYYPGLPVMGVRSKEIANQINQEETIFFDTRYAYEYSGTQFDELPSTLPTEWHGDDTMQFWAVNYQKDEQEHNLFWATNSVPGLHGISITAFAMAAGAGPYTVDVTATGLSTSNIANGDTIYLFNFTDTASANNFLYGVVSALNIGAGTFTLTGPDPFTNDAATTGIGLNPSQNISGDGIRYYNTITWKNYNPLINDQNALAGALMVIPYHQYFIAFNTYEGNDLNLNGLINYQQRARWSRRLPSDSVLTSDEVISNGWREDIGGGGSFDDAPTEERIITAGFIKDQLIVEFERSSWQLVYTQNDATPFYWQRINADLGSSSTFSAVTFDDGLLTFGNVGIHQCQGTSTGRIDQLIPEIVFNTHNSQDGPKRTSGIRDYFREMVYFSYSSGQKNTEDEFRKFYPDTVLVYNYRNQTWSLWDDCITSVGYYQPAVGDTWADWTDLWGAYRQPWSSAVSVEGFNFIAWGTQQGFVEKYNPDLNIGSPSLFVQAIASHPTIGSVTNITSPQHNLYVGQYVQLSGIVDAGLSALNGVTYQVIVIDDANTFGIDVTKPTGTYTVGGVITVVLNVNITTKMFTPFWEKGNRYLMNEIRFLFDKTDVGELQVNVFADFGNSVNLSDTTPGVRRGTSSVSTSPEFGPTPGQPLPWYSMQRFGEQIWKKFYCDAQGETCQVQLLMNDAQMRDNEINASDITLHGMMLYPKEIGDFN